MRVLAPGGPDKSGNLITQRPLSAPQGAQEMALTIDPVNAAGSYGAQASIQTQSKTHTVREALTPPFGMRDSWHGKRWYTNGYGAAGLSRLFGLFTVCFPIRTTLSSRRRSIEQAEGQVPCVKKSPCTSGEGRQTPEGAAERDKSYPIGPNATEECLQTPPV